MDFYRFFCKFHYVYMKNVKYLKFKIALVSQLQNLGEKNLGK